MKREFPKSIRGEERYVDFDSETALWGIFGTESGHCYGLFCDEQSAKDVKGN